MTCIRWFIRSMVINSIILSIYSDQFDADAIFRTNNLDLCKLIGENSKDSDFSICAIACPAEREDEKNLVEMINYRTHFLFMETIYTTVQELRKKNRVECGQAFAMSVLLHKRKDGKFVEFGFGIFYEESKFQETEIQSTNFNEFREVSYRDHSIWKRFLHFLGTDPLGPRKMEIAKWGFAWISKIEVRYNFFSMILTSLKYEVRPIDLDQLKATCVYDGLFSNEYNTNAHFDELYGTKNQSAIFNKVEMAGPRCDECVKKYNLVLPYHFQASSPRTILCSNMTTIPLWHEIPDEVMDRIEKFVIAVAQVLVGKNKLIVIPGVLGQLTLPSTKNKKSIKIYLDDKKKKVPVPKIIYKIVRRSSLEINKQANGLWWSDIVIVIHNYPKFTQEERLCPDDHCKMFGWDSIQYLNSNKPEEKKLQYVYCCKLNDVVAKSLKFSLGGTGNQPFNLREFDPYHYIPDRDSFFNNAVATFKKLDEEKADEDR